MPSTMTHNEFEVQNDLIKPITQFFLESNVVPTITVGLILKAKRTLTVPPQNIQDQASAQNKDLLSKVLKQHEIKRVKAA